HGWNQNDWPGGFGCASDLDTAAPANPAYLTAKSLHAGWANSRALELAGITRHTPDPVDGSIQHDSRGEPTGILFEKAMELMDAAIPPPITDRLAESIRRALPLLWQVGLTGVHDFDRLDCLSALQRLHGSGNLKLRVVKHIPLDDFGEALSLGLRTGQGDESLVIGAVKVFADGALGPHTAAMLEPYLDEPANCGMLNRPVEELYEIGCRALDHGLNLAVHAIGDRANRAVLDRFSRLRRYEKETGLPPQRFRIEHVQLLHPDDAGRLAELGVIASMQPIHAVSDMEMADRYWGGRADLAYAWRTLLAGGTRLAFGSDAPVDSPNPFWGLHAAVTRTRRDNTPPGGWRAGQCLDIRQAMAGYTLGPAFAAGMEDRLGCLAPGCLADLVVLERDPFAIPPQELASLHPMAVMVGGEWVWEA
ncbi:MAG: amidohydrolase, partial [Chloroflexi bacterium]|nr:amidohydrolase [Chloroflexota bacterium]